MTTATSTNYAPIELPNHHKPLKVTDDTYLIRSMFGEGTAPLGFYVNSAVILGKEPVIIDTGVAVNRRNWLDDVFSLVEPKDVRWIYISHDDHDHVGNLAETLDLCPNATLVSTWFQVERLAGDIGLPLNRMRWVNDGEAFDAGDRLLVAIRPPVFDSPTTRGLYDSKSKVYWASDCFASPVPCATDNVAELEPQFWNEVFLDTQNMISPWLSMVDSAKYNKLVDRVAELDLSAIISAHSPVITGVQIDTAMAMIRDLPYQPEAPMLGQEVLDGILEAMGAHA